MHVYVLGCEKFEIFWQSSVIRGGVKANFEGGTGVSRRERGGGENQVYEVHEAYVWEIGTDG